MSSTGSGRWQGPRRGAHARGRSRGGSRGASSPGPSSDTRSDNHFSGFRARGGPQTTPRSGHNRPNRPGGTIFMPDRPDTVDARIKDGSDQAVVALLNSSSGGSGTDTGPSGLPLRPDFGTRGREIVLRTNYFPVDVEGSIYRYKATITLPGRTLKRAVKQRVFELAAWTDAWGEAGMSGRVAHDGAEKLVASIRLRDPLVIRGVYYDEGAKPPTEGGSEYTLTLTDEEEVDQELLKACLAGQPVDSQALQKVLSALNLVLTACTSQDRIKIGRDDESKKHPDQRLFFDTPAPQGIGGGLTVREGFYVSVRPAHEQLMVNVNTCHAAFYKPQNFLNALDEYRRFVGGNTGTFGNQVRVKTKHNDRIVMIQGISEENARQHRLTVPPHGRVTLERFYQLKHSTKLQHPGLQLLRGPNGSLYPPELCDILQDQGFKGELTDSKHARAMLNVACNPPKTNAEKIVNQGLDLLGYREANPLLDSFGIHVGAEMAVVPGRVLDKPGLAYSSSMPATIDDRASWNLRNVKFALGARLDKWAVLVIQNGGRGDFGSAQDPELREIVTAFRSMCNECGMQVRPPEEQAYVTVRLPPPGNDRFRENAIEEIEQALRNLTVQTAPELVLVLLSDENATIYNGLKRVCDVKLDIATVCMQSDKVRISKNPGKELARRRQYFANVALKINMKLGGINHTLDANSGMWLRTASTMIMGMDVTHPARGLSAGGTPSIVAVVASIDKHFAQYPAKLDIRSSKVEIEREDDSDVLRDMFISRFELYKAHNKGRLPERVILYRDGVSESQFAQVRDFELPQMEMAFKHFGSYRPKLSIVVCGKRHHTRFYPTREEDAANDGNPLPGTVVDRGVTPAYEFDFFLQAHAGLKGTTRPTHYFVVHDENGFNADGLQQVTNDLSYMFSRATKAVSLVSAAYWADVACERGRCYLHRFLMYYKDGEDDVRGKGKGKETGLKGKGKKRAEDGMFDRAVEAWGGGVSGPRLKDTMYYL